MSAIGIETWGPGLLAWTICFALAGCQSTRFGEQLAPLESASPTTATLGAPTVAQEDVTQADHQEPIDVPVPRIALPMALQLAGLQNPTIALADEVVQARLAERMQ